MCKCLGKRRIVIMGSWNHIELYPHIACEKTFKEKEQNSSFCEELVKTLLSIIVHNWMVGEAVPFLENILKVHEEKRIKCYLDSQSSEVLKLCYKEHKNCPNIICFAGHMALILNCT